MQIYNPTAELAMLMGIPTNEAIAKIEGKTLAAETKRCWETTRKCSK